MMRLVRFPANAAWGFIFGQNVETASHISMDGRMLFPTRAEAVEAASYVGLNVSRSGEVTA